MTRFRRRTGLSAARKTAGYTQESLAEALGVDRTTVATWESGEHEPLPHMRPLLAGVLGVDVAGIDSLINETDPLLPPHDGAPGSGRGRDVDEQVRRSQEEWLAVRTAPGARGRELTELAAWLYPESERAPGGHVLTGPGWLAETPMPLDAVDLEWADDNLPYTLPASAALSDLLPRTETGSRYSDYGRAVRDLVRPRLLENRLSYRLTGITPRAGGLGLRFGRTTFFEMFNLKQLVAHEFKRAWLLAGREAPRLDDLPLRTAIGSPFNPSALLMSPGITTLTIRRGREPTFVLHERDGGKVADGGGLCHPMPAGEFQPSSAAPADVVNDFSLWRNVMREFSEEFLGNPEHDGGGSRPIDYGRDEPFRRFEEARASGGLRLWHLGLVVEPLELGVQQLTVAVLDAPVFDRLFGGMVAVNDEGRVVGRDGRHIPFTVEAIRRLDPRLSASGLTLLHQAWRARDVLLAHP